ncbi:hypothetical protein [Halobellus rubicundus]|uniref:Uncharacterized protein n=1 Tax=Halobellus rubicundus TaxID=2996466 RepID=A0ABD5MDP9_9EURY
MTETQTTVSTDHVGPIIFGHETARDQLLSEGLVATFRTGERTTGETHARWERTGEKKADVIVRRVCETDLHDTEDLPYFTFETLAKWSGFGTPDAWLEAIREVHGDVTEGVIYEVELVENELLACVSCEQPAPYCVCEGGTCPNCHGKGFIINCVDDLCHAKGSCMHGDNKPCPRCSDGRVYPKRVPIDDLDQSDGGEP